MRKSALLCTVFAGALLATGALAADAPPSDQIENITVTGVTGKDAGGGLITAEDAPKQRSTVTTDFIATQAPTANPVQLLSLLPGFNTGSSDAFGIQNSTFTLRGLDSTRVGALLEGVPLNDSGSFALYPSEWIDSENLSQISLTQGSADLDTPINSATGGIININMIDPRADFGVTVGQSVGSHDAIRSYVRLDTGDMGGYRAFISGSYYQADHFAGPGTDTREHVDFKAVHEWGEGNRIAPVVIFNRGVLGNYYGPSLSQWNANGLDAVELPGNVLGSATAAAPNNATYYYKLRINPFYDVIASMPSSFNLGNDLTLSVTPYLWYGVGNGGGATYLNPQTSGACKGQYEVYYATTPVCSGTASFPQTLTVNGTSRIYYDPSTTDTWRPGATTKVEWELENHHLVAGFWLEGSYQHQQQTLGAIDSSGNPQDIWGMNNLITMADGAKYTGYDETATTWNSTIFVGDTITALDKKLEVDIGVKEALTWRDAQNHELFKADPNLWPTTEITQHRSETLPAAAVRYKLTQDDQLFASYTTDFHVPNTFPTLFGSYGNPANPYVYDYPTPNLKDERSSSYEAGWRHQNDLVDSAISAFYYGFHDREQQLNIWVPANADYYTQMVNVGTTHAYGVDAEMGFHPIEHWRPYVSAEFLHTRLEDDIPDYGKLGTKTLPDLLPTAGKQVPRSPNVQVGMGLGYDNHAFFANLAVKYVGPQYSTLVNDEKMPGFGKADVTLGYRFEDIGFVQKPEFRLNILNITNAHYLSAAASTFTNAHAVTGVDGAVIGAGTAPYYYVGAPFAMMGTITAKF
jgi:iron complex outermembrane receptor protein